MSALEDPRPLDRLADFPAIPAGWAYLDTAATAQKPRPVIDAITRAYAETYATVHRGVYRRSADMTLAYEAARKRVARFIGAGSADEIVFVRGATEAINLVAQSWGRPISTRATASCCRRWSIIPTSSRGRCCATASASRSMSCR